MPARVIREEINRSESLARVSRDADLTFRSLIVACDDYGRIDGRLTILRAVLFPLRKDVTEAKLEAWLIELASGLDAPIVRYQSGSRPFISLSGWEKHRGKSRRSKSSKCPEPPSGKLREILENPGDPPGSRESGVESRESGESSPPTAPPASLKSSPEAKNPKPNSFTGEARERIQAWAAEHGHDSSILNQGLERFREWKPLKNKLRDQDQWVAAFMRIVREGVDEGKIVSKVKTAGGGSRYRSADDVMADAKRKQAEDDERARAAESDDPEHVAKVIQLSLRQAAGEAG